MGNVLQYSQNLGGSAVTTTYNYNNANQLTTAQMDNSPIVWLYVYDPNGRLTEVLPDGIAANGARRYTYNTAGYLTQTKAHDGNAYQLQAEMLYDGLGQRLSMTGYALGTSITANYVLDPMQHSRPLTATSASNATIYLYGIDPIAEFTTDWSYSLPDGTNTPRQLTNSVGEITLAGRYTPWGDSLDYVGAGNFTFGYFGGLMDSATGLLYVGNGQYYDPATGRFLTRDVYPNNPNPYVPSGDPTGALFAPLVLVGLIYGKKKKKSKFDYFVIVLFVAVGVGMGLSACAPANPPAPATSPSLPPPIVTIETITPYPLSTPDANKCNNGYGCTAYLTFDDGPDPSITPQIGLLLQAKGVRATFFLTGADVSGWIRILSTCDPSLVPSEWANKEVAALVKATGHAIGIHGWFHGAEALPQYFWNSQFFDPETYITQEIQTLNQIGLEPDPLLRAPGGQFPADVISGYENWYYYGWDVNSFDGPSTSADQIVNNVIGQLETKGLPNKPIILLHSIWPSTLESIANPQFDLIGRLKDLGYTQFDKLPRAGDNPGYPPNGEIYTIG